MKVEELDLMLSQQSEAACMKFFLGACEADRKAVSARAMQWYDVADAFTHVRSPLVTSLKLFNSPLPKRTQKAIELTEKVSKGEIQIPAEAKEKESIAVARLAILASCGLTDARKVGMPDPAHTFMVLRDRRPRWLDRYMDFICESKPAGVWDQIRQMERDGLAQAERGDHYWVAMAVTLGQMEAHQLLAELERDSEILDSLLWSMLGNEQAMQSLCDPTSITQEFRRARITEETDWRAWPLRQEERHRAAYIWKSVLIELAATGSAHRKRIIDSLFYWIARLSGDGDSRASINMPGQSSPVTWFHFIHDSIDITQDERASMIGKYIGLVSTKDVNTLSWALKNIGECPRQVLPVGDLLGCLPNVFYIKRKEPALAALKLLEDLARQDPPLQKELALAALNAFEHPSNDTHKRVMSWLKKSGAIEDPEIAEGLKDRLDRTRGLVKKEALELVQGQGDSMASPEPEEEADAEDLVARASAITGPLAEAAGLPAAMAAMQQAGPLPACLTLESPHIPRLDPERKISPVDNLDDLIYLYLHVLEGSATTDDIERVLDGMSRLCDLRPHDFDSRVSTVRKKIAERLDGRTFQFRPFLGLGVELDLSALGRAWVDGKVQEPSLLRPSLEMIGISIDNALNSPHPLQYFAERLLSLARRVARRIPLPLLAAPTHKGGFIDPREFVRRLAQWNQARVKLDKIDVIQALLRLAPENRQEALDSLPTSGDEILNAIRWALGGERKGATTTPEIWVAAFRCREPRGESTWLQDKFPFLGPDSALTPRYLENLKEYGARAPSIFGTVFNPPSHFVPGETEPALKSRPMIRFFPTELLHDRTLTWESSNVLEQFFPLARESFFGYQTRRMALYMESQGSYWQSSWESLFDPDVPINGMAAWLIALGLTAKQPEAARLALDALIAGIEDTRIDGPTFGLVMGKLFSTGRVTLSRWINALRDIGRISPLHLDFVVASLEKCLDYLAINYEKGPPIPMLELLYESCTTSGGTLTNDGARACLTKVEGKGKGAKLAKLLLELPAGNDLRHKRQVAAAILGSRLNRVERWQRTSGDNSPAVDGAGNDVARISEHAAARLGSGEKLEP